MSRRVDLSVAAGYSNGASVLQQSAQFDTYTGDVRSSVVLTRTLSAVTSNTSITSTILARAGCSPRAAAETVSQWDSSGPDAVDALTSQVNCVTRQKIYAGRHPRHRARTKVADRPATDRGTALGVLVFKRLPSRFRSETLIMVIPQRIPDTYVKPTVTGSVEDRLPTINDQILSRSRLERIINDFGLYKEQRATGLMEDVVQKMRS